MYMYRYEKYQYMYMQINKYIYKYKYIQPGGLETGPQKWSTCVQRHSEKPFVCVDTCSKEGFGLCTVTTLLEENASSNFCLLCNVFKVAAVCFMRFFLCIPSAIDSVGDTSRFTFRLPFFWMANCQERHL